MRSGLLLLVATLAAGPLAAQQALVCPAPAAGRTCDAYHYHVQLYRPDNKQLVEISATPQFATQAACERAREARAAAAAKVTDFFHISKQQPQYGGDRVGPCHCDMTADKSSPTFLTDAQRTMQLRTAEEIRLRVRERLLDNNMPSDSEVVRALDLDPPVTPLLGTPRLVPMPQNAAPPAVTSADDLKPTQMIDTTKPAVAAMDLPLVDLTAPPAVAEANAGGGQALLTVPASPSSTPAAASTPEGQAGVPVLQQESVVEVPVTVEPAPQQPQAQTEPAPAEEEDVEAAQETAERFISYETQRIQNVLKASSAIADENVKTRIFTACMQRIQLLSNLRLLIEGSGMRSRLAAAAREVETEDDRLALIAKLFGDEIKPHWAPQDATDVIFDVEAEVDAAPDRALRDSSGRFSAQQKKHALYLVLARTQPTEDQRLWLSTVVEGFLR